MPKTAKPPFIVSLLNRPAFTIPVAVAFAVLAFVFGAAAVDSSEAAACHSTVRYGSRNECVRHLQAHLGQHDNNAQPRSSHPSCYILVNDGIFGPATLAAVRSYQASHRDTSGNRLVVDGIVGPLTWGSLHKYRNHAPSSCYVYP